MSLPMYGRLLGAISRAAGVGVIAAAVALLVPVGTAWSATLGVVPDDRGYDSLLYAASPGEVNDFTVDPWRHSSEYPWGAYLPFAEASAPLTLGASCTEMPSQCTPAFGTPVYVYLGNRNDRANVVPFYSRSYVYGEEGDDDIVSNGNDAYAWGGPGNDTVRSGADSIAAAWGGAGDDIVSGGSGASGIDLHGDAGDDLLTWNGGFIVTADGGSGNDTIVDVFNDKYTYRKHLDAGPGDDVVIAPGAEVTGGAGRDVLSGGTGREVFSGDDGDDVIDVAGDPGTVDNVSCGGGRDTVRADPDDQIASDCEVRLQATTSLGGTTEVALANAEHRARTLSRSIAND
jgi:Ca2+-binding RTX toxin-like protein